MINSKLTNILLAIIAFILTMFALKMASELVGQLLLAMFIAIINVSFINSLRKTGLPHWLAVIVVIVVISIALLLMAGIIGSSVTKLSANLPLYQANLAQKLTTVFDKLTQYQLMPANIDLLEQIKPAKLMSMVLNFLTNIGSILGSAFTILLITIFMVIEVPAISHKLHHKIHISIDFANKIDYIIKQIREYLTIKTFSSIITGLMVYVLLLFIKIDYALLWVIVAFLLNYIPNVGSILAAIPVVLLAWIQFGVLQSVWVILGYFAINNIVGNWLEPRWMSKVLSISVLATFVSLIFWGWMFGVIGMFLSVPLSMSIKILLDSNEKSRWLAVLLS